MQKSLSMRLYDIHYHAFDLSHANLLAFLSRDDLITPEALHSLMKKLPWYMKMIPVGFAQFKCIEKLIADKARHFLLHESGRLRSLLSILENAIESHFLYIDYFLQNKTPIIQPLTSNIQPPTSIAPSLPLSVDKLILCPLLMDFGFKNMGSQPQFYDIPPGKPIVTQVVDMINAIYFYYHYEFVKDPGSIGKLKTVEIPFDPASRFLEIYPFLGIYTANYSLQQVERIFEKYFSGFENDTPQSRRNKLFEKMGTIHLDITEISGKKGDPATRKDLNYLFAGIKVYPPLGFDPWPDQDDERTKVELLYKRCIEKNIPIITHCSDGGFLTDPKGPFYSDPSQRWSKVLTHPDYFNLKLDFAHFGSQKTGETAWSQAILKLIETNPNVFSDISCRGMTTGFYQSFKTVLNRSNESRFLFGSDFLINMLWIDSYNHYLDLFLRDTNLDDKIKTKISNKNAEKFLFG
ncbi:MAG: amidohydrolase [Bacteroidetes bacterium]|nr:amidohydrolase [Bacteroidota bacterium]